MDVEMVRKRLVPGMKKGHEAEFAAQSVVRVRAELQQGFRHGLEQNVDCDFPVAENNRIQIVRDGEDVVEIFDRQHLALALFQPAFLGHGLALGAMAVAAGIVERDFLSAIGAFLNAASEPFRAAADYVRDDFELGGRHLVDLKVVAYMLAEYVGRLRILNYAFPSSFFSFSAGASLSFPRRSSGLLTDVRCFLET